MSFYTNFKKLADSLIAKYGQSATLSTDGAGAYNTSTGENVITTTNTTVNVAVFNYRKDAEKSADGTLIEVGDKKIFVSSSVPPTVNDKLTIGGIAYKIIGISEINPAGTNVTYEVHGRKG